jgi:hypothetical protein
VKGLFPEYSELSNKDYVDAWREAHFVFDTNVLLNLYRYRAGTRDELLKILDELRERIWIPHHVALEFQRNRLYIIAEQNRRFSEVLRVVEKTRANLFAEIDKLDIHNRHSLIDPQTLMVGFEQVVDTFLSSLGKLRETQQKLSEPDPLKGRIEDLFEGRVGNSPKDQMELDEITTVRLTTNLPPATF